MICGVYKSSELFCVFPSSVRDREHEIEMSTDVFWEIIQALLYIIIVRLSELHSSYIERSIYVYHVYYCAVSCFPILSFALQRDQKDSAFIYLHSKHVSLLWYPSYDITGLFLSSYNPVRKSVHNRFIFQICCIYKRLFS